MLTLRIYVALITILYVLLAAQNGITLLEALVSTCAVLFLILDVKIDLEEIHLLEARVNSLVDQP